MGELLMGYDGCLGLKGPISLDNFGAISYQVGAATGRTEREQQRQMQIPDIISKF